jgi:phospholipid N-methyltransferase
MDRMQLTDAFLTAAIEAGLPPKLDPTVRELEKVLQTAEDVYGGTRFMAVGFAVPGGRWWLPVQEGRELRWKRIIRPGVAAPGRPQNLPSVLRALTKNGREPQVELCLLGMTESYPSGSATVYGYRCYAKLPIQTPRELTPEGSKARSTVAGAKAAIVRALEAEGWTHKRTGRYEYVTSPSDQIRVQLKDRNLRLQSRDVGLTGFAQELALGSMKEFSENLPAEVGRLVATDAHAAKEAKEREAKSKARREAEAQAIEIKRKAERAQSHAQALSADAVVIRYSRPEGVLLCGATKANKEAIKQVRYPFRYKFSSRLPDDCAWYVVRTRDKPFTKPVIEKGAQALRDAGIATVVVDYTDPGELDVEAREAARGERQAERIERLEERVERKQAKAATARASAREAHERLPWGGEPVKVGHHSEGRHRRDIERAHSTMGRAMAAEGDVAEARGRLEAAERGARPESAGRTQRRIEKKEAEIRSLERDQAKAGSQVWATRIADLRAEVAHDRKQLAAAGFVALGPGDFSKGELWRVQGYPALVKRVSKKSVTFEPAPQVRRDIAVLDIWKVRYTHADRDLGKRIATAEAVARGTKVEAEHGGTKRDNLRVAVDHLLERGDYYDRLAELEASPVGVPLEAADHLGDDLPSELRAKMLALAGPAPDMAWFERTLPKRWRALTPAKRQAVLRWGDPAHWPTFEDYVVWNEFSKGTNIGLTGLPKDAKRRYAAMLKRDPRIEVVAWPEKRSKGTRYRVVRGGVAGPVERTGARGQSSKVDAARHLSERVGGGLPVFSFLGDAFHDPAPVPKRGPTGFQVVCFGAPDPGVPEHICGDPRALASAQKIAHAHARAWGVPAKIYQRTKKRRGPLVETVDPPNLARMDVKALDKLVGELESGLEKIRHRRKQATEAEGVAEWTRVLDTKREWLRQVTNAMVAQADKIQLRSGATVAPKWGRKGYAKELAVLHRANWPTRIVKNELDKLDYLETTPPPDVTIDAIEFTEGKDRPLAYTLTRSAQIPGVWQLTSFARDGDPWGHSDHDTLASAVAEARLDAYVSKVVPARRTSKEIAAAAKRGEVVALTGPGGLGQALEREAKAKAKGLKPLTAAQRTKTAKKLRELAAKTKAKGESDFGAPRKEDTHRRARMAASARSSASREILIAEILARVADTVERGELEYVSRISNRAELEALDETLTQAKYARAREQNIPWDERRHIAASAQDVPYAKFQRPRITGSTVRELIAQSKGVKGVGTNRRTLEAFWRAKFEGKRDDPQRMNEQQMGAVELVDKAIRKAKGARFGPLGSTVVEGMIRDYKRLSKLGIKTTDQLQAALREYLACCREGKAPRKEDPLKAREAELRRQKIPGFFPTPRGVVERMVAEVEIKPGDKVLEPSAGTGSMAEVILERHPEADLAVLEFNNSLRELLKDKGFNVRGGDFLAHLPAREGVYDVIVMNPPFEKRQDTTHIAKALKLLKPGGRIAAIASGSFPDRTDRPTVALRRQLDELGARIVKLPAGTFKEAGTGVATVLITARKAAARAEPPRRDTLPRAPKEIPVTTFTTIQPGGSLAYTVTTNDTAELVKRGWPKNWPKPSESQLRSFATSPVRQFNTGSGHALVVNAPKGLSRTQAQILYDAYIGNPGGRVMRHNDSKAGAVLEEMDLVVVDHGVYPTVAYKPGRQPTTRKTEAQAAAAAKRTTDRPAATAKAQVEATAPRTTQGASLSEARAAMRKFEARPSGTAAKWQNLGQFCKQRTDYGTSITICPAMTTAPFGDCPVVTKGLGPGGKTRTATAIALCQPGEPIEYFPWQARGGLSAAAREAERRFVRARARQGADLNKSKVPAKLPALLELEAQALIVAELVPSGIVAAKKSPLTPEPVVYAGLGVVKKDGRVDPYALREGQLGELQEGERLVPAVRVHGHVQDLGKFVDAVARGDYHVYLGTVPYEPMQALWKLVRGRESLEAQGWNLGHYRGAKVEGKTIYWLPTPRGVVGPVDDEGKEVKTPKILKAWRSKEGPFDAIPLLPWPKGTSVADTVQVATVNIKGEPQWVAYQPSSEKFWTAPKDKKWAATKAQTKAGKYASSPVYRLEGGYQDFGNVLSFTLRNLLDNPGLPPDARFRVAGPWLGQVWPSDYKPGRVVFDAATGGEVNVDALARFAATVRQRLIDSETRKKGEPEVSRSVRDLAKRWDQLYRKRVSWAVKREKAAERDEKARKRQLERSKKEAVKAVKADESKAKATAKRTAKAKPKPPAKPKPKPRAKPKPRPTPAAVRPQPVDKPGKRQVFQLAYHKAYTPLLLCRVPDKPTKAVRVALARYKFQRPTKDTEGCYWRKDSDRQRYTESMVGEYAKRLAQETGLPVEVSFMGSEVVTVLPTVRVAPPKPTPKPKAKPRPEPQPRMGAVSAVVIQKRRRGEPEKYVGRTRLTVVGPYRSTPARERDKDAAALRKKLREYARAHNLVMPSQAPWITALAAGGASAEVVVTESRRPKPKPKAKPKAKAPTRRQQYASRWKRNSELVKRLKVGDTVRVKWLNGSLKSVVKTQIWAVSSALSGGLVKLRKVEGQPYRAGLGQIHVRPRSDAEFGQTLMFHYRDDKTGAPTTGTYAEFELVEAAAKPKPKRRAPTRPPARPKPKPAKPKRKAPAKPKPKPKPRRGKYAVRQGGPKRPGSIVSTHRTKAAALKAAKTWVAKDQLRKIIRAEGKARPESQAVVIHGESNLEAHVKLYVPIVRAKQVTRQKRNGDSYEVLELGLVKLCNVDLGRRIAEGKAKKRAAKANGKPKANGRPKLTDKQKAANTRRLVAQVASGSVRI